MVDDGLTKNILGTLNTQHVKKYIYNTKQHKEKHENQKMHLKCLTF